MSRNIQDLSGMVFGRLTVVRIDSVTGSGTRWVCKCQCGNEKVVSRCRWASRQTQNENRKSVRWIEFDGKRMNVSQWAKHLGLSKATLYESLEKHPVEIALRRRDE